MTRRPPHAARWCAAALAGLAAAGAATAQPLPRTEHIARALAAVRGLGPAGCAELDRALYDAARTRCRADAGPPAASCLIEAARTVCAGATDHARCEAAADVIVANLRGQTALIDDATRFRLVRASADYHAALAAELHRRYAALAAELVLMGGARAEPPGNAATFARAIDELCARRDRALHACQAGDAACVPSLPWSRCVAALVWFIGGGP
ncbi:MAG TPA: hypothetical protein VHW23_26195 [Kofleriaceae bacterium]|nr:hypothetical protein [Kofleriaceae bacterium]